MHDNRDFEERMSDGGNERFNDSHSQTGDQYQNDNLDSVYKLKNEEGLDSVYKLKDEGQGGDRENLPDREIAERNSPYKLADEAREQWGEQYDKFYKSGEQALAGDDKIQPAQDNRQAGSDRSGQRSRLDEEIQPAHDSGFSSGGSFDRPSPLDYSPDSRLEGHEPSGLSAVSFDRPDQPDHFSDSRLEDHDQSSFSTGDFDRSGQPDYSSTNQEIHGQSGYMAVQQNRTGDLGLSSTDRDMNNSPRFSDTQSPEDTSTGYSAHEVNASSGYIGRNAGQPSISSGHDVNVPVDDSQTGNDDRAAHDRSGQDEIMPGGNTGRNLASEQDTMSNQGQSMNFGDFQAEGGQDSKENHISETVTLNTDPVDLPSKLDNI